MSSTNVSPRVLFYSHDSCGLGHLRRSLTLARRLVERVPGSAAIVATGSPCATHFPVHDGVDVVKLPSIGKDASGAYIARSLGRGVDQVVAVRRAILASLWDSFSPDLLVVDHQVTGLFDEMLGLLERSRLKGTRTILGVRDIIDAPDRVAAEWGRNEVRWALREGYDRVCVYGSESVFDARATYPFPPELASRLEYVGYVVRPEARTGPAPMPELEPQVLVTTGGGEDGERRICAYVEALQRAPAAWQSTIVLGPMLSADAERRLRLAARGTPGIEWHRFLHDLPQRMARADVIVSMAGYNTVAELLAARRRPVLVPRRHPRREQELRAGALERLGLAWVADERDPARLRETIDVALEQCERTEARNIALDGVDGLVDVAVELLGARSLRAGTRVGARA